MTSSHLTNTLSALAIAALGLAGCSGDAPVESAEEESTGGGEAEASCGTTQSQAVAPGDSQDTTTEAEASCGEGSCG